mmetsp:Transcript_16243/g.28053  ORF Transcript_16243/g.28053 Transcript_16243/m.28053 type:complete len:191 (+) Transcript_16243:114-686(+)|eukprot:CAMPEP_0196654314 /NCGR_PEP_ID=MMETSP1086-20130531/4020_1 /TAXON_ID=77921 /ORGANISM="Cyanoptyche  gloeocystis , Strain SAG4.97" /LENGTH=190 /DNA_ID=CAMNT_0041986001 /DNA_START=127 /DNA_END=699 /DNA_ORIENTATION=-
MSQHRKPSHDHSQLDGRVEAKRRPLGELSDKENLERFAEAIYMWLDDLGCKDAEVYMRGSAVVGRSHKSAIQGGGTFDRVAEGSSDYDIAIVSDQLMSKATPNLTDRNVIKDKRGWPLETKSIDRSSTVCTALGAGEMLRHLELIASRPVGFDGAVNSRDVSFKIYAKRVTHDGTHSFNVHGKLPLPRPQ